MAETILNRIALGDKTAVQDCLDKYGGLVWALARRMSPNAEDAEDAVQEIFVDIWKNADRFDENQSSETTFIAMIARRRLIDRLRHHRRRISADSLEDMLSEPTNRADEEMQIGVEAQDAARALQTLRPEQRQVLILSIVQGLSHQEIAKALKMPLGTVKTHARRGLLLAREFLEMKNRDMKGGTT